MARDGDGSGPWLWAFDLKRKDSRRASVGLEQYTSVQASMDGRKLVALSATQSLGFGPFRSLIESPKNTT